MPQKNPLQNRNRTAQWTHNERGKVRSPSCLGSCIALFLRNPPHPHFQKRGSCPSSSPAQFTMERQAGREKGAHLRDHLKKIFKSVHEYDIVRESFQRIVLLGKSSHWQIGKTTIKVFSHPAPLLGEQDGRTGKSSLKVLQVLRRQASCQDGSPLHPSSRGQGSVPTPSSGGKGELRGLLSALPGLLHGLSKVRGWERTAYRMLNESPWLSKKRKGFPLKNLN